MTKKSSDADWDKPIAEREKIAAMYADPENAMAAYYAEQALDTKEGGEPANTLQKNGIRKDGRTTKKYIKDLVGRAEGV